MKKGCVSDQCSKTDRSDSFTLNGISYEFVKEWDVRTPHLITNELNNLRLAIKFDELIFAMYKQVFLMFLSVLFQFPIHDQFSYYSAKNQKKISRVNYVQNKLRIRQ